MPAKRFNEADIDFNAIDGELAVPPKLDGCAGPFAEAIVEQQAKGVTVAPGIECAVCGRFWTRA